MSTPTDALQPDLRRRATLTSRLSGPRRSADELRAPLGCLARTLHRLRPRPAPETLRTTEEWITRADGSGLRLLVIRPRTPRPDVPGLLWLHGGGYVMGEPEQELSLFRAFVEGSGCVVVAPACHLGTEAPYPAALDDCYSALRWLRENAERLGVRDDQIGVGGASAGGGLTAATTLAARDRGEIAVAFQMPIYPMIDDRTPVDAHPDTPIWDTVTNRSAWSIYLGEIDGTDDVPAHAAPARALDLSGLPPTMTYVGDVDPFHDETVRFAERLRGAGVPVELRVFPGACHGFDLVAPGALVSGEARAFRDQWFGHAVRTCTAPQPSLPRPSAG